MKKYPKLFITPPRFKALNFPVICLPIFCPPPSPHEFFHSQNYGHRKIREFPASNWPSLYRATFQRKKQTIYLCKSLLEYSRISHEWMSSLSVHPPTFNESNLKMMGFQSRNLRNPRGWFSGSMLNFRGVSLNELWNNHHVGMVL